jgi:hypothetical protein
MPRPLDLHLRLAGLVLSLPLIAFAVHAQASPPAALAATRAADVDTRYDQAQVEYEIGHFASAFAIYAALADEGHAGAARIAFLMWRHGARTYAMRFDARPEQLARWRELAAGAASRAAL